MLNLLAHLRFQAHMDCQPVQRAFSVGCRIYHVISMGDWWWDGQDQYPAGVTIVPVICASEKTHLTYFLGDQHVWPLYLTFGNIGKDICQTPEKHDLVLIRLIPLSSKGAMNIHQAPHNTVGTVLSQPRHLDITGPGLKWDCTDGFQRQCYPLWLAGSGIIQNN